MNDITDHISHIFSVKLKQLTKETSKIQKEFLKLEREKNQQMQQETD